MSPDEPDGVVVVFQKAAENHVAPEGRAGVAFLRAGALVVAGPADTCAAALPTLDLPSFAQLLVGQDHGGADEIFLTGTAAQITAVTRVDHRPVGTGQMGPVTTRLRSLFFDVVRGRIGKYRIWCTPVE